MYEFFTKKITTESGSYIVCARKNSTDCISICNMCPWNKAMLMQLHAFETELIKTIGENYNATPAKNDCADTRANPDTS